MIPSRRVGVDPQDSNFDASVLGGKVIDLSAVNSGKPVYLDPFRPPHQSPTQTIVGTPGSMSSYSTLRRLPKVDERAPTMVVVGQIGGGRSYTLRNRQETSNKKDAK